MKKSLINFLTLVLVFSIFSCNKEELKVNEATDQPTTSQNLKTASETIKFNTNDPGVSKPMSLWAVGWIGSKGMDDKIQKMGGAENIDIVRIGCPKEWALDSNNELVQEAKDEVDKQLSVAAPLIKANPNFKVSFVCSSGNGTNDWYVANDGKNLKGDRWVLLAKAIKKYINSKGLEVAYIEMCNEQDFCYKGTCKKGDKSNFNNIMGKYQDDQELTSIPLVGPSTLNCNLAKDWYNATKSNLDWGATHIIGGNGSHYIDFVKKVKNDGKEYFASEIHHLVEMIIAAEYGALGGSWWNNLNEVEGLFTQCCQQGNRVFYMEDAGSFSAACGYKGKEPNTIHVFLASNKGGTFTFKCGDRDVYFNGKGPKKEHTVTIGGSRDDAKYIKVTW